MIYLLELNKPNHSEDYWYLYLQEKLKYYNYKAKHKLKTQSGRIFEKYVNVTVYINFWIKWNDLISRKNIMENY